MTGTKQVQGIVFKRTNNKLRFLALKRVESKGGFWQPVTGMTEIFDSSLMDTLYRELMEEISLDKRYIIRIIKDIHTFKINKHYLSKEKIKPITEYVFGVEIDDLNFFPNVENNLEKEHESFKWLTYSQMLNILKWKDDKIALKKLYGVIKNEKRN